MRRTARGAWKAAQGGGTLLLALVLACNLYLIAMERIAGREAPTLFGWSMAVVVSGSMEPALRVDDLILNHAQRSYGPGDIITFHSGSSLTTHRIAAVTPEGYVIRGDANNAADPDPVAEEAVVGRVVGRVPQVGRALRLLKTPLGMTLLVFAGFLMLRPPFFREKRGEPAGREEPNEKE